MSDECVGQFDELQQIGALFRDPGVAASYMSADTAETFGPYTLTIQCSRRFAGLKLFMSLIYPGLEGCRAYVEQTRDMADYLKELLVRDG